MPHGIIRWRVSWTSSGQIKADKEEPFQKLQAQSAQASRERCIRKTNPGYENFKLRQGVGMRIMLGGKVAGSPEVESRTSGGEHIYEVRRMEV